MVALSNFEAFKMHNRTTRRDLLAVAGASLVPPALLAQPQYSIPVDQIKDIKIVRTVVGGETVYEG
jgi:predicted amidohydrolase YtcJ